MIEAGLPPRTYEAGRLRSGDKDAAGRPRRLDGFRFTTNARALAEQIADLYQGDEVRPWGRQWEVYTRCRELEVTLPPGGLVVEQAMMRWTGGGPSVVCTGRRTIKPKPGPCMCPQPGDPCDTEDVWRAVNERRRLASLKEPQGCKAHTWMRLMLPDIDGFGVWTLHSTSENAAAEIVQQAMLLERARAAGQFLPATAALEYKESRVDGLLRQYNVPALRVNKSIRAIAELGGATIGGRPLAEQLPPPPGRRAISAGTPAAVPPPAGEYLPPAPELDDEVPDLAMFDDRAPMTAQQIADLAGKASGRGDLEFLASKAKTDGVYWDLVSTDPDHPDVLTKSLEEWLTLAWKFGPDRAREMAA